MEQLRQEAIREDLELNAHMMQKFIDGPVKVITMLLMLQNDLYTCSKIVYLGAMEAKVSFQQEIVKKFGDIITQYQAWHCYVIEKQQVGVVELDLSQTTTS